MGIVLSTFFAGWTTWSVILLVVGLVLITVEMFIPGFGVFGIAGIVALLIAIIMSAQTLTQALIYFAIMALIVVLLGFIIIRSFGHGKLSRSPFVLNETINSVSTKMTSEEVKVVIGKAGVCLTPLRPAGKADFSGKKFDVLTSGEFVNKGEYVLAERIEGLSVIVKEISSDEFKLLTQSSSTEEV